MDRPFDAGAAALGALEPHRPRPIRFLGYETCGGWIFKLYGISATGGLPDPELIEAMRTALPGGLSQEGAGHGIGFAIAHQAADFAFVLIDWWSGRNELHQKLLSAPLDRLAALAPHDEPAIGCVWELAVTDFERRAWLRHVLMKHEAPDVDEYLAQRCEDLV